MATEEALINISVDASADLSTKQYHFMTINSSGLLATTGDGLKTHGVLQDKPDAANRAGTLAISGVSKVVAGASVTAGDDVAPNSAGRAVTASTTGDVVSGVALNDATGNGNIISVLIRPQAEPAT